MLCPFVDQCLAEFLIYFIKMITMILRGFQDSQIPDQSHIRKRSSFSGTCRFLVIKNYIKGVILCDSSTKIMALGLFNVKLVLPMKALEVNNAVALSDGACPTSLLFNGNTRSATYNMFASQIEGIYHCISFCLHLSVTVVVPVSQERGEAGVCSMIILHSQVGVILT